MITTLLAATLMAAPVQQIDSTLDVRNATRVTIENMTGTVIVRSWDRDQLRVRASNRNGVEIDQSRSSVSIDSEGRFGMPGSNDFEITVPRRFDIDVEGINLTVEVHEVTGDVVVETINGDVAFTGLNGRLHAETVQGAVTIGDSQGNVTVDNANGSITITNHQGDIAADAVNGAITLRQIRSSNVRAETVNGPIEYGGGLRDDGRYRFATHMGDMTLYVPENTNAAVSVETWRGEIDSDFPIQISGINRRDRQTFTLGNGSARVEIESFGGRVRLRRPGSR